MAKKSSQSAKAFEAALKRGLHAGTYDPPVRDIVRIVKGVLSASELTACMAAYCNLFNPTTPPTKRESLELARTSGYNLFVRAVELADATNGMADFVAGMPEIPAVLPDATLPSAGFRTAKRFSALDKKDRDLIQAMAAKRAKDIAAAKRATLVDQLLEQQRRLHGRPSMTLAEMCAVLKVAPERRSDFEASASACEKAWTVEAGSATSTRAREALDKAFDGFSAHLAKELKTPADLVRILQWVGEAAGPARVASPWSNVWPELYLDALAVGQRLAVTQWNIGSAIQARGFTGPDAVLLFGPLTGKVRALLLPRLKASFANHVDFSKGHRSRRQAYIVGKMLRVSLLDEVEAAALVEKMKLAWETNPVEVVNRSFRINDSAEIWKSRFFINQSAKDAFTVLWIEKTTITLEVHRLPGYWFQASSMQRGIPDLLKDSVYRELARNAANLTAFMLAYLQVLGIALDVATAGASGGLRMIVLRFAEEQLKDYAVGKVLDMAKIENPWVQTLAGFAVGAVPSALPKPPKLGAALEGSPPHPTPQLAPTPVPTSPAAVRPPSGVPPIAQRAASTAQTEARLGAPSAGAAPPTLEVVPDTPSSRFQPAPKGASLTPAEEAARAAQGVAVLPQAKVYQLPISRVANDEVAVATQQVAMSSAKGGGGGHVTTTAASPHGTGTYVADGVLRRPAQERPRRPPQEEPEEWDRALDDPGTPRDPVRELPRAQMRDEPHAQAGDYVETGKTNIRPKNPGGQRMNIKTEAGQFMHWLMTLPQHARAGYAEALRRIAGNPAIPTKFDALVKSGRIISLKDLPDGLSREIVLAGGKLRVDRKGGSVIYEMKPNSEDAIDKGLVQVDGYVRLDLVANQNAPPDLHGIVVVYDQKAAVTLMPPP